MALIAEDKKVLLIDTNFRRPASKTIFPNTATADQSNFGLSNLLNGQCNINDAIRSSGIENLDVIDTGIMPARPAELLGAKMRSLLDEVRKNYDHIILDGPPALLVTDAKLLATMVDVTILVLSAANTKRGTALRTLRELREINGKITGCVLFGVKALKGGYFHETFQSYREYQKVQLVHTV